MAWLSCSNSGGDLMSESEIKVIWKSLYSKKDYQMVLEWWEGLKNECK